MQFPCSGLLFKLSLPFACLIRRSITVINNIARSKMIIVIGITIRRMVDEGRISWRWLFVASCGVADAAVALLSESMGTECKSMREKKGK